MSKERYISTDKLANRLINQDPTVLLIDVRPQEEFKAFALPNAVNVPLSDILNPNYEGYLNQEAFDVILYSNDNYHADQAWLICNRLGYKNLYALKGGLNTWFNTIIDPKMPAETEPKEAFILYDLRKASAMYFGVGTTTKTVVKKKAKNVILIKKKKKVAEGGC